MGIWAIWVPLGSTIMFIIAPILARYWGWEGVWWFGFFYTLLIGFFFLYFHQITSSALNLIRITRLPRKVGKARSLRGFFATATCG